jgi:AraC family transcriptional regulator
VGASQGHQARCFLHENGVTPMVYLNRYRVNRAKMLLTDKDKNITEVALAVGFPDGAYFSHVFRREVGISPNVYRRGRA